MASTGLPVPNPTQSYWQTPAHPISNHRSTPSLPETADYVIVGSGITGSSIAYKLLESKPKASIILLEARTVCSAATGRNGGHCRTGRWGSFHHDLLTRGEDEALRLEALEEGTVRDLTSLIKKLGINCDLRKLETADVFFTPEDWTAAKACLRARKDIGLSRSSETMLTERKVWEAEEARSKLKIQDAVGAVAYPAYTLSLTNFRFPFNPVWNIRTERGNIVTPNVILATNAYTSALHWPLSSFLIPTRLQIAAILPGTKVSKSSPILSRSVGLYGTVADDYYMSRSKSASDSTPIVLFGGGRNVSKTHEQSITDDSTINPKISEYLKTAARKIYFGKEEWGEDQVQMMEWTGIAGNTVDNLPVVGQMKQVEGIWLCVGFNGHGMALAFRCAEAVVGMVTGRDDEVVKWFPRSCRIDRVPPIPPP